MREEINKCIDVLRNGGIILYPTDTIWGIGCDANNEEAIKKIIKLKNRPSKKGIIALVSSEMMLARTVVDIPEIAWDLIESADKPLTIIYDEVKNISDLLKANDKSCAIRLVKSDFCTRLIQKFGKPITSTSANISNKKTANHFEEIDPIILDGVDYVVNFDRENKTNLNASNIVKLKKNGVVKIIR